MDNVSKTALLVHIYNFITRENKTHSLCLSELDCTYLSSLFSVIPFHMVVSVLFCFPLDNLILMTSKRDHHIASPPNINSHSFIPQSVHICTGRKGSWELFSNILNRCPNPDDFLLNTIILLYAYQSELF